jgi:hypothetical protein
LYEFHIKHTYLLIFSDETMWLSGISLFSYVSVNSKKIFSGRYAQPHDPYQHFYDLEKIYVNIPHTLIEPEEKTHFSWRGALPHHNEIAVDKRIDDNKLPKGHNLYSDCSEFNAQFEL